MLVSPSGYRSMWIHGLILALALAIGCFGVTAGSVESKVAYHPEAEAAAAASMQSVSPSKRQFVQVTALTDVWTVAIVLAAVMIARNSIHTNRCDSGSVK